MRYMMIMKKDVMCITENQVMNAWWFDEKYEKNEEKGSQKLRKRK